MDRFDFRIQGLKLGKRGAFKRQAPTTESRLNVMPSAGLLLWPLTLLAAHGLFGPQSAEVGNPHNPMPIKAKEVLVVLDISSSMNKFQAPKDAALAKLRSKGIQTGNPVGIWGTARLFLETINGELAQRPRVDAIWVISDFHDGSDLVKDGDTRRYQQLLNVLRQRGIRFYLSSVDKDPPWDHLQAARLSGGDWGRF